MRPDAYAIIPRPAEMRPLEHSLRLADRAPLYTYGDQSVEGPAEFLCDELARQGLSLQPREDSIAAPGISLSLTDDESFAAEGAYRLWIDEDGAAIVAGTSAGILCGIQTLLQLIPEHAGHAHTEIPGVEIIDFPRYSWRGMHLDVSRHFFPVDFVKKYIDQLARHKMNRFHWHLTDDQGWRIETLRYPKLTQLGAWRKTPEGQTYGGFYSQEQIRDVVSYAARRGVMIIPEIEMPGHARAALAAYPEYSCTGGPHTVATEWGIFDDVYCAGNRGTIEFLGDILAEVADLFPGPYIHIGGDECPRVRWEAHELCQRRVAERGLAGIDDLQADFIARIARRLEHLGKRLIGWDEILDGGAPGGSTVMAWRSIEKGIVAAALGHDVIMSPTSHCYFDHYQAKENEPKAIGGFTPLEKVYAFEPVPHSLVPELRHRILGAQANVWTEYMADERHVEYMTFPRLCALSEVLWSPREERSYDEFLTRLRHHVRRLERWGVQYRRLSDS